MYDVNNTEENYSKFGIYCDWGDSQRHCDSFHYSFPSLEVIEPFKIVVPPNLGDGYYDEAIIGDRGKSLEFIPFVNISFAFYCIVDPDSEINYSDFLRVEKICALPLDPEKEKMDLRMFLQKTIDQVGKPDETRGGKGAACSKIDVVDMNNFAGQTFSVFFVRKNEIDKSNNTVRFRGADVPIGEFLIMTRR